ncbi:hypothetical protein ABT084_29375 [Streptomyces sp. NPDC002138]|uniref:hypothetical protein n=1 Tax=Streptomyces sp. NPDC002138 TaxID=3154410 RepID=UPI00332A5F7F
MTTAAVGGQGIPAMPERTPRALREAIAQHAPQLLPDFDAHWKRDIADAYDIAPVPAFMARWWGEYAIARDPLLEQQVHHLEDEAAEASDIDRAKALLEEAGHLRRQARQVEPGR